MINEPLTMKNLFLISILFVIIASFRLLIVSSISFEKSVIITDTVKNNKTTFKRLAKKWVSSSEIIDGKVIDLQGVFTLILKPNSTFESFYKPDNLKNGIWKLENDSTFTLYLKALDVYRILELTDSTLTTEILWTNDKKKYKFKNMY